MTVAMMAELRGARAWAATMVALLVCAAAPAAETFDVGLSTSGVVIEGAIVPVAGVPASDARTPVVVLVGGLRGDDDSAAAVRAELARFDALDAASRSVTLVAIPVANPDGAALRFPPTGTAYRENAESHVLWRWIGAHAPDLVLMAGDEDFGLGAALAANAAAGLGGIPARRWAGAGERLLDGAAGVPRSAARRELERRLARTPRQLAEQLAMHYGRDFERPWYIEAIALNARLKLGDLDDVRRLAEPYASAAKDTLERPSSLAVAGHIVFTELARATGDPRYTALVRKAADTGFDETGAMREAMPYHNEFSDSVFMGTTIAAQAGALTGERRYFDMAGRHLRFMQGIDRRPDGLYRHQPATDTAWGRGNGFAALGLALTLTELPADHPDYSYVLASYREHMAALLPYQNRDGLWRNVVDHPGAYAEYSATAMIGFAMLRGLRRGWFDDEPAYRVAVERAWHAVNARTGSDGTVIDVCESTARIESLDGYLEREAILGMDPRAGAMAMQFAVELSSD